MADDESRRRRNAKASMTRNGKTVMKLIELKRPHGEVTQAMDRVLLAYTDTVKCHDSLMMCSDDTEFETGELWIDACRVQVMEMEITVKDYIKSSDGTSNCTDTDRAKSSDQNLDLSKGKNYDNPCAFKLERPKLPTFTGDVRDYMTFKSDFKHVIESRYSKRDSIAMLRACLVGKPLEMIRGIGEDYDSAWDYLDAIYGDPRFLADMITRDIMEFDPLTDGEDERFCEYVHLVKRCYHSLSEVKRQYDMDNNHMLAVIEQKLCMDDRKVWARELEHSKESATLDKLLRWMTTEMKARIRATAEIRNRNNVTRSHVNYVNTEIESGSTDQSRNPANYRCWICKSADHWVDECQSFKRKTYDDRIRLVTENNACYSCLKRAGRHHTMETCTRRKQCTMSDDGHRCRKYHSSLLHPHEQTVPARHDADTENMDVLLPTVVCHVFGESGHMNVNVLLDSGAQVSLVSESLVKKLNLSGKSTTVKMTTVGNEQVVMNTRVYQIPVQSLDDQSSYTIKAFEIPSVNDDNVRVNLGSISAQLGIPVQKLHRMSGPIDLLIGTDHVHLHNGYTKSVGNLIGRQSPLGWVVFGTVSTRNMKENSNNIMYNAKSSQIVPCVSVNMCVVNRNTDQLTDDNTGPIRNTIPGQETCTPAIIYDDDQELILVNDAYIQTITSSLHNNYTPLYSTPDNREYNKHFTLIYSAMSVIIVSMFCLHMLSMDSVTNHTSEVKQHNTVNSINTNAMMCRNLAITTCLCLHNSEPKYETEYKFRSCSQKLCQISSVDKQVKIWQFMVNVMNELLSRPTLNMLCINCLYGHGCGMSITILGAENGSLTICI